MNKRISLTRLSIKYTGHNVFSKIIVIFNASIVLGLSIYIASIGLGILRYQDTIAETNRYYNIVSLFCEDELINDIFNDPQSEAIEETRILSSTDFSLHDINGILFDKMNLSVDVLISTTGLLLMGDERESGFEIIGSDFTSDNQVILSYYMASFLAKSIESEVGELLGLKLNLSDGTNTASYTIIGVIAEETTVKMGIFSKMGIIINQSSVAKGVEQISIQSSDFLVLEHFVSNYVEEYSSQISYLEEYQTQQAYFGGMATALMIMSFVSTVICSAIIYESVNASFRNSLPFYSMMKIIGLKNRKISTFLFIETGFSILVGFLFAIPLSNAISRFINSVVDFGSIFGIESIRILNLDILAIISSFISLIMIALILLYFQIRKLNSISITERSLYELEFLS